MTKEEIKEIEYMIGLTIRKDLSRALQRLLDKSQVFCEKDRELLIDQVKLIAQEYDLHYLESQDRD